MLSLEQNSQARKQEHLTVLPTGSFSAGSQYDTTWTRSNVCFLSIENTVFPRDHTPVVEKWNALDTELRGKNLLAIFLSTAKGFVPHS